MKNYLIISLIIISVGVSQQNKTDEPNPMKGVKTQTELEYHYEEKFGEFEEIFKGKHIAKYDSNGNKVEWSVYDSYGSLSHKFIYKYDSNGKEGEGTDYDSDGLLTMKWNYKYDSKGNVVEELYNKKDGHTSKVIYKNEYDTKNRIIEVRTYHKRFGGFKTPTTKTTYEYEEY